MDTEAGRRYDPLMKLSARNQLPGTVAEIKLGNVMAHVVVRVRDNEVDSVITRRSAEELKLRVGNTVTVIIKSTEAMLQKS
jgi:molybdopterin-binding protein